MGTYDRRVPIYEYLCEGCGRISEVMQKISDPPPRTCPECGSRKIAKLVSRTSFQLKGGGWYSDLYSSKKEKAPAEKAPGAATGDASAAKPAAGAGEAKPAPEKATPAAARKTTGDPGSG
jgi:putative FmdB family regulatory protein